MHPYLITNTATIPGLEMNDNEQPELEVVYTTLPEVQQRVQEKKWELWAAEFCNNVLEHLIEIAQYWKKRQMTDHDHKEFCDEYHLFLKQYQDVQSSGTSNNKYWTDETKIGLKHIKEMLQDCAFLLNKTKCSKDKDALIEQLCAKKK